jgi:hypothetical protein
MTTYFTITPPIPDSMSKEERARLASSPFYGKIKTATLHPEVRRLWATRDDEPPPCEPIDIYWPTQTDPEVELLLDYARRLLARTRMTQQQWLVLEMCTLGNATLADAGARLGVTGGRARQLLVRAHSELRIASRLMGGCLFDAPRRRPRRQ